MEFLSVAGGGARLCPVMTLARGQPVEGSLALFLASWAQSCLWKTTGREGSGHPCPSNNDHRTSSWGSAGSVPGIVFQKNTSLGFQDYKGNMRASSRSVLLLLQGSSQPRPWS